MAENFYGEGQQGKILTSIHDFLAMEIGVTITFPRMTRTVRVWESDPEIYNQELRMQDIMLDALCDNNSFRILSACVALDGGDTQLKVLADVAAQEPADARDPYIDYFSENFIPNLMSHSHATCLSMARERQQKSAEKSSRLMNARSFKTGERLR